MPHLAKAGRPIGERRNTGWAEYRDNRSASQRGYGAPWRKLRDAVLASEPLCRMCARQERTTAATTVDHIRSKRHGGTDDLQNLQPLCDDCHKTKTANERLATSPRFVITGPPMSGKSTWVKQRAQPGDLVWDLDDLASTMAFFGQPIPRAQRGKLPWSIAKPLLVMRDALMGWLMSNPTQGTAVYVIVTDCQDARRIAHRIKADVIDLRDQTKAKAPIQ
jgi:5-methylcytosine-specific restriction protein A